MILFGKPTLVPLFLSLFFCSITSPIRGAGELKPEDMIAGFRYNFSQFRSPRIVWRSVARHTKAWYDENERTATALEVLSRGRGLPREQRAAFMEQAQNRRSMNSETPRESVLDADYWTDRQRFQVRIPSDQFQPSEGSDRSWQFPGDATTRETLPTIFKDYCVASYDPAAEKPLRVWTGVDKTGMRGGLIGMAKVEDYTILFSFPPLGVEHTSWGSRWNPIDTFFAMPLEELKFLGAEHVSGRKTYVLEHTKMDPVPDSATKAKGKVERASVTTAWVDPERGYLPLRIEETMYFAFNGRRLGNPKVRKPHRVVEVSKISRIPQAGFYPVSGVIKTIGTDPNWKGSPLSLDDAIAGKTLDIPTTVWEEMHWEVQKVEPNKTMPGEMFALDFPNNTHYLDQTTSRPHIVGLSDEEVDRLIAGASSAARRKLSWWWIIALNLIVLVGIGGAIVWRARKRRAS